MPRASVPTRPDASTRAPSVSVTTGARPASNAARRAASPQAPRSAGARRARGPPARHPRRGRGSDLAARHPTAGRHRNPRPRRGRRVRRGRGPAAAPPAGTAAPRWRQGAGPGPRVDANRHTGAAREAFEQAEVPAAGQPRVEADAQAHDASHLGRRDGRGSDSPVVTRSVGPFRRRRGQPRRRSGARARAGWRAWRRGEVGDEPARDRPGGEADMAVAEREDQPRHGRGAKPITGRPSGVEGRAPSRGGCRGAPRGAACRRPRGRRPRSGDNPAAPCGR